jgi:all-trans-retinol 13,14-reductase
MNKIHIQLVHKVNLIEHITCLIFQTKDHLEFRPGQYLAIEVAPKVYRSYSLFYCNSKTPVFCDTGLEDLPNGNYIGLMINTKPDGVGSHWAKNIELRQEYKAVGPSGTFLIRESVKNKVFVATSTGIAPFIPMIKQLLEPNPKLELTVFFGALSPIEDFSNYFFDDLQSKYSGLKVYKCYDNLELNQQNQANKLGRVTQIIPQILSTEQIQSNDFYLCGNPLMVEATSKFLEGNHVANVYYEKY